MRLLGGYAAKVNLSLENDRVIDNGANIADVRNRLNIEPEKLKADAEVALNKEKKRKQHYEETPAPKPSVFVLGPRDFSTPRTCVTTLLMLIKESIQSGADTPEANSDIAQYGHPLYTDMSKLLKIMGNATVHPTIPYRPHVYLERASAKIASSLTSGLARVYGNSTSTQDLNGDTHTFKVRFALKLREVMKNSDLPETYTSDDNLQSDKYVRATANAFKTWMHETQITPARQSIESNKPSSITSRSWSPWG